MMRHFVAVILIVGASATCAESAETIPPGIEYINALQMLARHGYEVDSEKFGLAVAARDESEVLEFCRVEEEVTLALVYDQESDRVVSLWPYVVGNEPKSKRSFFQREVLKMSLEDDGTYMVQLRRNRPSKR